MNFQINVDDQLTPLLDKFEVQVMDRRAMMQKLGEDLAKALREHFRKRDSQPNRKGWPKRHFWNKEGRDNTALTQYNATSATVTIASAAIAHKVKGGTVRPKRARALAISAIAQAYKAIQPSAMDNPERLAYVPLNRGNLVAMLMERRKNRRARPRVWFWIVKQATHRADPKALPPPADLERQVQASAQQYLDRIAARGA